MGFASDKGKLATRLLTKYDERKVKAVLITPGTKAYDPLIGDYVTTPPTEQPLTGVSTSFESYLIANGTVHADDIKFMATNAIKPTKADSVRMDGLRYGIEGVKPKNYTGDDLTIAYEIQLRK